jgi:hypothetical protein
LQAVAFDIKQPAMEGAAQTAVFETPIGKIGPAMRTGPAEEAVASLIIAEDHKVFAQKPHRLDWPLGVEFVGQGRGLPIAPQHLSCRFTRTNAGKPIILFRAEHTDLRKSWRLKKRAPVHDPMTIVQRDE